jgi:ribonuclease Z
MLKAFGFKVGFPMKITEITGEATFSFEDFSAKAKELKHSLPCLGYSMKEKDNRRIKKTIIKKLGIPDGPLLGELQNNKSIKWKNKTVSPKETTYLVEGKKVAFIFDTLPCNNAYDLAKDADVLVAEAVYGSELYNKAEEYMHMTAEQSAKLASQGNVKKLVLSHYSQRYKTTETVLKDAKEFFENTVASYDFMKLKI